MGRSRSQSALRGSFVALAMCWLGAVAASAQQDPRVAVRIEPEGPIGLDELVQLTIEVAYSGNLRVGDARPELDNLEIMGGPSQGDQIQFVNGVSSRSRTYTWVVRAQRLGEARVTGGTIRVEDDVLRLPQTSARVVEEAPPRQRARRRGDPLGSIFDDPFGPADSDRRRMRESEPPEIFLEAEVKPRRPYVGQQVVYTLYLYTNVDVRSVVPTDLPEFKGFWATPIPQPDQAETTMIERDGKEIGRVVLLQRAIFARRPGRLDIGPVRASMGAVEKRRSIFGPPIPRLRRLERASNSVTVDVQPLPESQPAGFQGLVGRFGIEATVEPTELSIGDAATLRLVLQGLGHLQSFPAPELPIRDDLEVFPPQQQGDEQVRGEVLHGTRTWSYVLVPKATGAIELPPVRVDYFDPRAGEYRSTETETLRLAVRGATRATQDEGRTIEMHPIRTSAIPQTDARIPGVWPPLRHLLFGLPLLAALALLLLRRSGIAPGSARAGQRKRLLAELAVAEAEDRPRQVAAAIEDAWRRYLEDRWQVPQGTASGQWSGILVAHGVSRKVAEELVALADDLHYLRYAPKLSSTDEMRRELIERSRRLARQLR